MATPTGTNTYLIKWMGPAPSGARLQEHTVRADRFVGTDNTVSFVDADGDTVFLIRHDHLISIERTNTES